MSRLYALALRLAERFEITRGAVVVDGGVRTLFTDLNETSDVAIAERTGRQMRDEIVTVANDVKMTPPRCHLGRRTSVEHARTSESNANDPLPKRGTVKNGVFVTKERKGCTVAVSDGEDRSDRFVLDGGGEDGANAFPAFQKARVALPWGLHIGVGGGVQGQVVHPIPRSVARLEEDAKLLASSLGIPAHAKLVFAVSSADALQKQGSQFSLLHVRLLQIAFWYHAMPVTAEGFFFCAKTDACHL